MDKYKIEFGANISFDSKDSKLFKCHLGKDSVSIPRKGMIKGFQSLFQISRIHDIIKDDIFKYYYRKNKRKGFDTWNN